MNGYTEKLQTENATTISEDNAPRKVVEENSFAQVIDAALDLFEIKLRSQIRKIWGQVDRGTLQTTWIAFLTLPFIATLAAYGLLFNLLCLLINTVFATLSFEKTQSLAHVTIFIVAVWGCWFGLRYLTKRSQI